MTISFMIWMTLLGGVWAIFCFFFAMKGYHEKNWFGESMAFFITFAVGLLGGVLGPLIVARLLIFPYFGTTTEFDAVELREVEENNAVVQYVVYEDGTEYNLTRGTGQYYTELPETTVKREQCTFLWVVEWDQRWFTGLDFVDR